MLSYSPLTALGVAPSNLLPAGLPDLLQDPGRKRATALYYDGAEMDLTPLPNQGLAVFETAQSVQTAFPGIDINRDIALGPRGRNHKKAQTTIRPRPAIAPGPAIPTQIGIIDAGLAFWNPGFGARFGSVSGLGFRKLPGGDLELSLDQLPARKLAKMVRDGGTRAGSLANQKIMARQLPSSVFSFDRKGRSFFGEGQAAHGTVMADMVLQTAPSDTVLHSMELPTDVLRDLTGGLLRAVLDVAVRGLVDSVLQTLTTQGPVKLVVLLAFGIVGGPQGATAQPEILQTLAQTQAEVLAQHDVTLEFVFPTGNHRQDQYHAQLAPNHRVDWIVQPDDFSANTLEVLHDGAGGDLTLTAPDGNAVTLTLAAADQLGTLDLNGESVGAVWTTDLGPAQYRTRITLAPTAARTSGAKRAPFGRWGIESTAAPVLPIWVLRDETGFEPDPGTPYRKSWLEDKEYRRRDALGYPAMQDPFGAGTNVRRAGTASVLTVNPPAGMHSVAALSVNGPDDAGQVAYYSGALEAGVAQYQVDIGTGAALGTRGWGPFGQRATLGGGGGRWYWSLGTSLSAALKAGELA